MKDYEHSFSSVEELAGEKSAKNPWLKSVTRFFRKIFGSK